MLVEDERGDHMEDEAPYDTAYKRWSCHIGLKLLCILCRTSPPPAMGPDLPFLSKRGWLVLLLTKAGDVETNPGPTTLNKKVWICDTSLDDLMVYNDVAK